MEGKKVKTINNIDVFEDACRLIDGKYYIIGNVNIENSGDVYEINGRFVRMETDRLIFNQTTMKYELKNQTAATSGYVSYDHFSKKFREGYFEFNELYDFYIINEENKKIPVYFKCFIPSSYREYLKTGDFYHISVMKATEFYEIANVDKRFKESFPYNSQGHTDGVSKTFEANYKPIYNKNVIEVSKLIKGLSFGLEFETTKGIIPNAKAKSLPLLPLRDGSIEGLEYVTIPLSGVKGLQALVDSVEELGKRTAYDSSCSLHIHIGNIPRTPEFALALFKLYSVFSDEIYKMFPHYKKENLGVKRKNYSEPYNLVNLLGRMDSKISSKEEIIRNFAVLFDYLSETDTTGMNFSRYGNKLENVESHPRDPGGEAKWNIHHRYHVVNFIPLLFVNKATVEFRIHTPTYDVNKILYFMSLCSAIINTAMEDTKAILSDFGRYLNNKGLNRDRNVTRFLCNYIQNSDMKNKGSIMDDMHSYFDYRTSFSESEHKRGKISYNEDDLTNRFNTDFKRKMNVNKTAASSEEEIPKYVKSELSKRINRSKYQTLVGNDISYNAKKSISISDSELIKDIYSDEVKKNDYGVGVMEQIRMSPQEFRESNAVMDGSRLSTKEAVEDGISFAEKLAKGGYISWMQDLRTNEAAISMADNSFGTLPSSSPSAVFDSEDEF